MNLRKIAIVFFLLLTLGFGYQLFLLEENKQLWGYWSFGFLISLYFLLISFFYKIYNKEIQQRLLYILSTGVLLTLGFPNMPFTPLMFVGMVPLLLLFENQKFRINVFKDSFFAFLLWNTLSTWWVANASLAGAILANYLNSILMAIPFLVFYFLRKKYQIGLWFLVSLWIGFEMIHLRWDMSWPWLTLGNSFAEFPSWVQWYEYTGVMGGSVWIWIVNLLVFQLYKNWSPKNIFKLTFSVFVPILISILIPLSNVITLKQKSTEVLTIQPNFEPFFEKFNLPESIQLDTVLRLIEQNITPNTKFVILPETVISGVRINDPASNTELVRMVNFMKKYPSVTLLAGLDAYKIVNNLSEGNAVRKYERAGTTTYLEAYNAATSITSKDTITNLSYYHKSKLVPGPEILPFKTFFRLIAPVFDKLGGTIEGLATQENRTVFFNENLKIAPVICYESIYGDFMRGYIRNGAQAIAVMTNDGWWDNTPGYQQHMKISKLRAIEFRKQLVRSANSGISCFINQNGQSEIESKYNQRIALKHNMIFNNQITFYAKYGDWIGWLVVCIGMMGFLKLVIRKDN